MKIGNKKREQPEENNLSKINELLHGKNTNLVILIIGDGLL